MNERQPAEWMCVLDERILELLQRDGWSTASIISRELRMNASRARTYERLRMLRWAGLVAPIHPRSTMYELTTEGQLYLRGKLDARNRPRPNPRAV